MPDTHDIGSFFWHTLRYPVSGAARWSEAWTTEIEEPYRIGAGKAIRFGRQWALVVGRWRPGYRSEVEALRAALEARDMDVAVDELRGWDGAVQQTGDTAAGEGTDGGAQTNSGDVNLGVRALD